VQCSSMHLMLFLHLFHCLPFFIISIFSTWVFWPDDTMAFLSCVQRLKVRRLTFIALLFPHICSVSLNRMASLLPRASQRTCNSVARTMIPRDLRKCTLQFGFELTTSWPQGKWLNHYAVEIPDVHGQVFKTLKFSCNFAALLAHIISIIIL